MFVPARASCEQMSLFLSIGVRWPYLIVPVFHVDMFWAFRSCSEQSCSTSASQWATGCSLH
jgi:hypothetical protein